MERLDKFINQKITEIKGYVGSNSVELVFESGSITLRGTKENEIAFKINTNAKNGIEGLKLNALYYSLACQEYVLLLENGIKLEIAFAVVEPVKPTIGIKED